MRTDWTIRKAEDFVHVLNDLPSEGLACRGQETDYKHVLRSKIDRCLRSLNLNLEEHLATERAVCQRFREHAPIYLSNVEAEYLKTPWLQLVVMQHYGAPTRLLDWTKSPWVAAYFAVSSGWESDGYVYVYKRSALEERAQSDFGSELKDLIWGPFNNEKGFSDSTWDLADNNRHLFDPHAVEPLSEWVTTYYSRKAHFQRLVAQQGLFTFASKPQVDHWDYLCRSLPEDHRWLIAIARDVKAPCLGQLNQMGLNGATLFPGTDGIGRSLDGFARVWPLLPRSSHF